jgi:hypothetical protein
VDSTGGLLSIDARSESDQGAGGMFLWSPCNRQRAMETERVTRHAQTDRGKLTDAGRKFSRKWHDSSNHIATATWLVELASGAGSGVWGCDASACTLSVVVFASYADREDIVIILVRCRVLHKEEEERTGVGNDIVLSSGTATGTG